jgi:hypothetical protein
LLLAGFFREDRKMTIDGQADAFVLGVQLYQNPRSPLGKLVAFAHLTVEAGKVYYLGTHASVWAGTTRLQIDPIDSEEAKYLIASSPLSVSHPIRKMWEVR